MPKFQPFPLCCGASIITDFSIDPGDAQEYEMEQQDTQWGPVMKPKLDANGDRIPKATYGDQFVASLNGAMGRTLSNRGLYANYYKDHGVFAILSGKQIASKHGKNWLKILKQAGFEHVRSWNNTVHGESPNHLFMLCKHTSSVDVPEPTTPPKEWVALQEEVQSPPEPSKVETSVVAVE
jgi:hypothetical protein